jgi:hypothetical protein
MVGPSSDATRRWARRFDPAGERHDTTAPLPDAATTAARRRHVRNPDIRWREERRVTTYSRIVNARRRLRNAARRYATEPSRAFFDQREDELDAAALKFAASLGWRKP